MKILLVAHQFFPDFSAGTEVLTLETAKALQREGHEAQVFAGHPLRGPLAEPGALESYCFEGVPVMRFSYGHVPMGGSSNIVALEYDNFFLAGRFRRCLEALRPDVVHFFHLQRLSSAAIEVCASLNIPMVLTVTDFWPVCPTNQLMLPGGKACDGPTATAANCLKHIAALTQTAWRRRIAAGAPEWLVDRIVRTATRLPAQRGILAQFRALAERADCIRGRMRRIDRLLAPTALVEQTLLSIGLDAQRIRRQAFGIVMPQDASRMRLGGDRALRVGFVGTLYEHKGAHVLIEALRYLPGTCPITVEVYGDLEQFPRYVAGLRARASGENRVAFRGSFPRQGIYEIMGRFDVLAVPSLWHENMPLVIMHARAAGCVVVGSDVAGISEVVRDGEDGLLFPPGDAGALARILSRLALERSLVTQLISAARLPKAIDEYTRELLVTYRELCKKGVPA